MLWNTFTVADYVMSWRGSISETHVKKCAMRTGFHRNKLFVQINPSVWWSASTDRFLVPGVEHQKALMSATYQIAAHAEIFQRFLLHASATFMCPTNDLSLCLPQPLPAFGHCHAVSCLLEVCWNCSSFINRALFVPFPLRLLESGTTFLNLCYPVHRF